MVAALSLSGAFCWRRWGYLHSDERVAQRLKLEARILLDLGRTQAALRTLEAATEHSPSRVDLLVARASILLQAGQARASEDILRGGLARFDGEVSLSVALGELFLATSRPNEALIVLRALQPGLQRFDPDLRMKVELLLGEALLSSGQPAQALDVLRRVAQEAGANQPRAISLVATAHLALNQVDDARIALDKAAELSGDPIELRLTRARAELVVGDLTAARSHLEPLLRDLPANEGQLLLLGQLCLSAGAEQGASQIAALTTTRPVAAHAVEAELRRFRGDLAGSLEAAEQACRYMPTNVDLRLRAALAARLVSAAEREREHLEVALRQEPRTEIELHLLGLEERTRDWPAVQRRALRLADQQHTCRRALVALCVAASQGHSVSPDALTTLSHRLSREDLARDPVAGVLLGMLQLLIEPSPEAEKQLESELEGLTNVLSESLDALEAIELTRQLARSRPDLSRARFGIVRVFEQIGRRDLARAELESLLAERPQDLPLRLARIGLAYQDGDEAMARAELLRLEGEAKLPQTLRPLLGELLWREGSLEQARDLLESALHQEPASAAILVRLARVYAALGDDGRALESLRSARTNDPRAQGAQDEGVLLLARRRTPEAVAALGSAIALAPGLTRALACAQLAAGDLAGALRQLETQRTPNDLGWQLLVALAGGQPPQPPGLPGEVVASARSLDPVQREAMARALGLFYGGWLQEARAAASELEQPDLAVVVWCRLLVEGERADPALRRDLVGRLCELAPSDPVPAIEHARLVRATGAAEQSLSLLNGLRERFPADARVLLAHGHALEVAGRVEDAIAAYRAAAALEGTARAAANNLAYLLGASPATRAEALELARKAASNVPRAEFLDTLGWLLHLSSRSGEAVPYLERAVSLDPRSAGTRFHLASALHGLGEVRRAALHLGLALSSAPADFTERALAEKLKHELDAAR